MHLAERAHALGSLSPGDIAGIRRVMAGLALDPRPVVDTELVAVQTPTVRGTWTVPKGADPQRRILYCHGGSFAFGDAPLYAGLTSRIGQRSRSCVFFADYRLAPEHPFPAAHDDCHAALHYVATTGPAGAERAHTLFTAGDSSGANLAISAALAGMGAGLAINGVLALSPFVDLAVHGESWTVNRTRDPVLSEEAARGCATGYAPGMDPRDPRLSALFADLTPIPRLQIQGSMADPLRDDAVRLAIAAHAVGVPTTLHLWPDLPHAWYLFAAQLADAARGVELAADFLRQQ